MASSPGGLPATAPLSTSPPLASLLLQLPPPLWLIVAAYLPLLDKLTQLPRLTRLLRPLPPSAFQHDGLLVSDAALQRTDVSWTLPPPLHAVSSLSLTAQNDSPWAVFSRLFPPNVRFPHLRSLVLHCSAEALLFDGLLWHLFRFPAAFSALTSVAVLSWPPAYQPVGHRRYSRGDSLPLHCHSALGRLSSLLHLTLQAPLQPADLRHLLALPLTELDLSRCELETGFDLTPWHLSPTVHSLHLPLHLYADERSQVEPLLDSLRRHPSLSTLSLPERCSARMLKAVAAIPSLTSLQCHCWPWVESIAELVASASTTSLPPLCHLRCGVTEVPDVVDRVEVRLGLVQRPAGRLVGRVGSGLFFQQYAASLTSLHLTDPVSGLPADTDAELRPLLEASLQCSGLRSLRLTCERLVGKRTLRLNYGLQGRLPHLHTLHLHLPLTEGAVVRLVALCPAVEDCSVHIRHFSLALLPSIGQHCLLLRRLSLLSESTGTFSDSAALAAATERCESLSPSSIPAPSFPSSPSSPPLFSRLRVLRIASADAADVVPPAPPELLAALPRLLRAASSRLLALHLGVHLSLSQLLLFAPFTGLRCLTLPSTSNTAALVRSYCRPQSSAHEPFASTAWLRRVQSRGRGDESDVADHEELLEGARQEEGACELQPRHLWADGQMDGRAALFEEVARRVRRKEEEVGLHAPASPSPSPQPPTGADDSEEYRCPLRRHLTTRLATRAGLVEETAPLELRPCG